MLFWRFWNLALFALGLFIDFEIMNVFQHTWLFLSRKKKQTIFFFFFFFFSWPRKCIRAAYWHSLEIFTLLTRVCNHCYRQVLPITTIAVQKVKPAESLPSSNPSKEPQPRKTWSRIKSRKTWLRVIWCLSMTNQGARQRDAIKHPSNIRTDQW